MAHVMSESTSSNMIHFLAGALLPTLSYFLLNRSPLLNKNNEKESDKEYSNEFDDIEDDDSFDEGEDATNEVKSNVDPKSWGMKDAPYKMVLIVNKELKMGKGKIAAQCCHAAVECYKSALKNCPDGLRTWEYTGCAKIAVLCPTQDEMLYEILPKVKQNKIPYYLVADAGRTQIAAGSRTVLGLGPAPVYMFEGISDHLKLM